MVYDSTTDQVIVFGGTDSKIFYNDTWAYSFKTNAWTEMKPSGDLPSIRCALAMVFDPDTGKVILFGGIDKSAPLGDTWLYDPAANTWTNLQPGGTTPSARSGHAMVYDPEAKKVVLFGGKDSTGLLDDTWTYDVSANTWTQVKSDKQPAARVGHSMAYDSSTKKTVVFGGWDMKTYYNSTWAYDSSAGTWVSLSTGGSLPGGRAGQCMVYDVAGSRILMFGGTATNTLLRDVVGLDSKTDAWTTLQTSVPWPDARTGHALVYDSSTNKTILFGGWSSTAYFNDLWSFSPAG